MHPRAVMDTGDGSSRIGKKTGWLTGMGPWRSLKKRLMKDTTPTRTRGWGASAASLITLLAMLVAPACAPLCAVRACSQAQGTAKETPCHFAAAAQDKGLYFSAVTKCSATELQVADLGRTFWRDTLRTATSAVSLSLTGLLSSGCVPEPGNRCHRGSNETPPPGQASSSLTTVVLRI